MGNYVNLIRPDGSLLQVNQEDAKQLRAMGYQEEGVYQSAERNKQEAAKEYYSGGTQGLKAFVEGALSGATFGISDHIAKGLDWDTSERAQYNPGKRFAGEITGMIAGSLIPITPAGMLASGAAKATAGIGSRVARGAAVGAIEGAAQGVGSEVSHVALTGDPLTVESAIAGAGWGAIYGGGAGALFGGLAGKIEGRAAEKAAERAALEKAASPIAKEDYALFRGSMEDASNQIRQVFKDVETGINNVKEMGTKELAAARATVGEARLIREGFFNEMETAGMDRLGGMLPHKKAGIKAFNDMKIALSNKDWEAVANASVKFEESLAAIQARRSEAALGGNLGLPEVPQFSRFQPNQDLLAAKASNALKELGQLGAASKALKSLPTDAEGFAAMTQGKADRVFAAVDSVLGSSSAELEGMRQALKTSISDTATKMGVAIEGTPGTQLRGMWEQASRSAKSAGEKAGEELASGKWNLIDAAKKTASFPIWGVMSLKGAVLNTLSRTAETWGPRVVKAGELAGSKIEPLKVRLDGMEDKEKGDRMALMKRRADEIRAAAPTVKDTIYRAVAPLDPYHTEFAQGLYNQAVTQFQFLLNKLPKDPGTAYSGMQSLNKPDPVAMEKFSRYYEAFQNPVQLLKRSMDTMKITFEGADGVKNMWPALWSEFRLNMLQKLSDPEVMKKVSYDEQVRLGTLLDLPIHSTMTPQFVANQQQMFAQRNEPLNMRPQPGVSNSGGRPSPTTTQQNQQH